MMVAQLLHVLMTTSIKRNESDVPVQCTLFPCYPNPFNLVAAIRYQLLPNQEVGVCSLKTKNAIFLI